jgi:hypothetical protein
VCDELQATPIELQLRRMTAITAAVLRERSRLSNFIRRSVISSATRARESMQSR